MTNNPYDDHWVRDQFLNIPVIEDQYCPPDKMYLIEREWLLLHRLDGERRRFWYKPWTWRRKNIPGAPWKQYFGAVKISGQ